MPKTAIEEAFDGIAKVAPPAIALTRVTIEKYPKAVDGPTEDIYRVVGTVQYSNGRSPVTAVLFDSGTMNVDEVPDERTGKMKKREYRTGNVDHLHDKTPARKEALFEIADEVEAIGKKAMA